MTHSHKAGHLRLLRGHEPATAGPEVNQAAAPPTTRRASSSGLPAVLKTVVYASVLAGLVGLQPLITLAAFELAHSHGVVVGLSVWVAGSASSTYALLGHLRR